MEKNYKQRVEEIGKAVKPQWDQYIEYEANKEKIENILKLKEEKNVLILGHNYMIPLVFQLSLEKERGDSLALSKYAAKADNPIILFNGVLFMAETAKILNPTKKVLIADLKAGCSLADAFKGTDVIEYKKKYPGAPVVTYINSYADVKAESDYCCTSANAPKVVMYAAKEFKTDKVIFLPDTFMGKNIQDELDLQGIQIDLIYPGKYDNGFGRCEVHEQFTLEDILNIRKQFNMPKGGEETAIIAHWECRPEVLQEADYYGSTSQMGKYLFENPKVKRAYLATECEMAANLEAEFPNVDFVKACSVYCPHMRLITLDKVLYSLENEVYEVNVDEEIRLKSLKAIENMLKII
jgi:quinolinate synthase